MEVVLREDFPALGYTGDVVSVRRGYARNFLIPKGIAVERQSRKASMIEHVMQGIQAARKRRKLEAEAKAKELEAVVLQFKLKMGSQDKSFGSISSRDMLAALIEKGHTFERKQVRLAEPIRTPGKFTVSVQLHSEVLAKVAVVVEGISSKSAKSEAEEISSDSSKESIESTDESVLADEIAESQDSAELE
jgi:large subunit ribosomal protein L9